MGVLVEFDCDVWPAGDYVRFSVDEKVAGSREMAPLRALRACLGVYSRQYCASNSKCLSLTISGIPRYCTMIVADMV